MNDKEKVSLLCLDMRTFPPVEWGRAAEECSPEVLRQAADRMTWEAAELARRAEYFERRAHGQTHAAAVRAANSRVAKVRRALGFSQARDDREW